MLITHNTEVLAYDGKEVYTCPIKARNLSGRTGRGDTTFAGYITERQRADIKDALQYCTALVSLKMETPGPFQGTRQDVLDYIKECEGPRSLRNAGAFLQDLSIYEKCASLTDGQFVENVIDIHAG